MWRRLDWRFADKTFRTQDGNMAIPGENDFVLYWQHGFGTLSAIVKNGRFTTGAPLTGYEDHLVSQDSFGVDNGGGFILNRKVFEYQIELPEPAPVPMTALDYANRHANVVVRYAGNGFPTGTDVAWIPPDTVLPFELDEIEGEIDAGGTFNATNLADDSEYKFTDLMGNTIYGVWLRVDPEVWQAQYLEMLESY